MRKSSLLTVCSFCTLTLLSTVLVGCSNGSSDALSVVQSNDNGTIAALQSQLATAQAAQTDAVNMAATVTQDSFAAASAQASYNQLASQLNNGGATPPLTNSQSTPPASGQGQSLAP